jgi:hypothetical protein
MYNVLSRKTRSHVQLTRFFDGPLLPQKDATLVIIVTLPSQLLNENAVLYRERTKKCSVQYVALELRSKDPKAPVQRVLRQTHNATLATQATV